MAAGEGGRAATWARTCCAWPTTAARQDRLDPAKAFPAIDHFSVAFLRYSLGIDKEPVGLNEATAATFDTADVTFTSDPS